MSKCLKCKQSVNKSVGQIVYWHKKCRTEGRRLLKLRNKY